MAYISKDDKNVKAILLRALGKKYAVKLSVSRDNHSTIVLTLYSGKIDFFKDYQGHKTFFVDNTQYIDVNPYYLSEQFKSDSKAFEFLNQALDIMNSGNWNNSDIMTDYFDIGFYVTINIGKFKKPYVFTGVKNEFI
jgi:hypothetical protein